MKGQKQKTDKLRTNILGMVLVLVVFGLGVAYVTIAFGAQDAQWFVRGFSDLPSRIVIYHEGQRAELTTGQQGFSSLAEAIRASLASGVPRTSGLGLSQGSLDDAYQTYVTVEAFFSQPVKLHASFATGQASQMLFPITGCHSDRNVVFLGKDGAYFAGAPVLNTTQPIRDALKTLGYMTE